MAATTWIRGKCIGRGAFGTVHLAFDRSNGDVFAVKSVEAGSCLPSQLESLENEILILRSLPPSLYVVNYLGNDVSKDMASTSHRNLHLEYLPGGTVADVAICKSRKFSEAEERILRSRVKCVVDALRHIHSNGIVHCDVKGRNVLVGSVHTVAKLVDFGSAVRVEDLDRSRIVPRGSPLWMAPEVVRGEKLGPKSDVWSLGCTVIEMVTGKPAWEDKGIDTLSRIGYSGELPKFPSQLSENGRDFLEKCMRREYTERWSCDQLLQHPFLAAESADSIAIPGSGCSPRCVLDWPDYEIEEEDREVSTSELDNHEVAARGVIGKLSSSVGPNWESDGWDWMLARDGDSDSDRKEEASGGREVEGTSLASRDSAGTGMEFGWKDVEQNNEMGGEEAGWSRRCHHYDYLLVDVGGTHTLSSKSKSMFDCSVKSYYSHPILLLSNFWYFKLLLLNCDVLFNISYSVQNSVQCDLRWENELEHNPALQNRNKVKSMWIRL